MTVFQIPQSPLNNDAVIDNVNKALQFALWLTEFYGSENETEALGELRFLDSTSKNLLVDSFKSEYSFFYLLLTF